MSEQPWDGTTRAYRPAPDWRERVSPELAFHEQADEALDPVTYEVIRHRLWTINIAHGETITRISGSPVFATLDFNMSLMAEDGEIVLNAPYLQWLDAGAPLGVRFLMERFSADPGIHDGDVWLSNDPWIAASHQPDVLIACPVFVEGRLFAWVSNAGHQYDLGGIVAGGWPQNAPDVWSDPVVLPPFKLVERGAIRRDLEAMYLRQSRLPDLVAFDLRAQLAGATFAAEQLRALCEQFGAATVKATMRRILDESQRAFQEKLRRIPDGTWSEVRYFDEALPGDRSTHRMQVNLTKRGDTLTVDNAGTDAQGEGTTNFTFASFAGSVIGTASVLMLHEQLFAIGGAERQIAYEPEPGTMTCADHPAAVAGSVENIITHTGAVQTCISRMLACDPELKRDIVAAGADEPLPVLEGRDDRGNYFGSALLDSFALGSGARSFGDGVDTGGPVWSPLAFLLNVEQVEQWYPLIYLYRREALDGGGAGRWRGGTGMDYAITPYRAQEMTVMTNAGGMAVSTHGAEGLFGGLPSPTAHFLVRSGTNLADLFARRRLPADVRELEARETTLLRGKSNGTPLRDGDVLETRFAGGGGYGDPLEREPWRVAEDVRRGYVSAGAAERAHGVVLAAGGAVDEAATDDLRAALLAERAAWTPVAELDGAPPGAPARPATGEPPRAVHEHVVVADRDGARVYACERCGHVLGGAGGSYKRGLLVDRGSVTAIPGVGDPAVFLDEQIELRRYCCPGCKVQMAAEIVRASEPVLDELRLA